MIVTGQYQNVCDNGRMNTVCVILCEMKIVHVRVYACGGEWEGGDNGERVHNDNTTLG